MAKVCSSRGASFLYPLNGVMASWRSYIKVGPDFLGESVCEIWYLRHESKPLANIFRLTFWPSHFAVKIWNEDDKPLNWYICKSILFQRKCSTAAAAVMMTSTTSWISSIRLEVKLVWFTLEMVVTFSITCRKGGGWRRCVIKLIPDLNHVIEIFVLQHHQDSKNFQIIAPPFHIKKEMTKVHLCSSVQQIFIKNKGSISYISQGERAPRQFLSSTAASPIALGNGV